jgi:hypothetical protein
MSIDEWILHKEAPCSSGRWEWRGTSFSLSGDVDLIRRAEEKGSQLTFKDGSLVGSDRGEWGGELSWHPLRKKAIGLINDNVAAIIPDGDNAVAIFGLAHLGLDYGYALTLRRPENGGWETREVGRFFSEPSAVTALGDGEFAV